MNPKEAYDLLENRLDKIKYYEIIAANLEKELDELVTLSDTKDKFQHDLKFCNDNRDDQRIIVGIQNDLYFNAYVTDLENTLELVRMII